MAEAGQQLQQAWDALEAARWEAARKRFAAILEEGPSPDAEDGLGLATWFLGDVEGAIAIRERAFEGYAAQRRCDDAARMAVWVSHQHLLSGRSSAARGWLARAERAVSGQETCEGIGWVAVERARHAGDPEERARHARRAMTIGSETGSPDLEVFAISILGRAEVDAGRLTEGMELLEEAMAAASAGRVRNVHTLAEAYCNLIVASANAGDFDRAAEWCATVDEFARDRGAVPLFGACRTVHADVLLATGRWDDAERALEEALAAHSRYIPAMGAPTVATLAELRVRQGRLREAEKLLSDREEHPGSLRALALLRIAEGEPRLAAGLLERGLAGAGSDVMRATALLAPLVDARLACEDVPAAAAAAAQLERLAQESGIELVRARSLLATARVALASGDAGAAVEPARRALGEFTKLGMPLDVGEARLELARSLLPGDPDLAREEARAANAAFRELGASRAMDLAASVLRALDAGTSGRPRVHGELTARESEVLDLLALGHTNAQIAQSLFISEKTAGHHVSHILSKLGVRNRAEAAAYAVRSAPVA